MAGLDSFVFNLIILGTLTTSSGRMWKRKPTDLYILEVTETGPEEDQVTEAAQEGGQPVVRFIEFSTDCECKYGVTYFFVNNP